MLTLAAGFGVLNNLKLKGLHTVTLDSTAQRDTVDRRHTAEAKRLTAREVIASEAA